MKYSSRLLDSRTDLSCLPKQEGECTHAAFPISGMNRSNRSETVYALFSSVLNPGNNDFPLDKGRPHYFECALVIKAIKNFNALALFALDPRNGYAAN